MTTPLRQIRESAGLTREELAAKARVAVRTIAYVEGGRDARASTLQAIAEALGVPVSALLDEPVEVAS